MPLDPETLGQGLTALNGVTRIVKSITGALKESGKSEAITQVIELQTMTLDLIDKNRALADEVRSLTERLNTKAAMHFRSPFYFKDGSAQPYCAKCWNKDEKDNPVAGPWKYEKRGIPPGCLIYKCAACDSGNYLTPKELSALGLPTTA